MTTTSKKTEDFQTQHVETLDAIKDILEKTYTKGHVDGFNASNGPDYQSADARLSTYLSEFIDSIQGVLKLKIDSNISLRYSCNTRQKEIGIAVLIDEKIYIQDWRYITELLIAIESIFEEMPNLATYMVVSKSITQSDTHALNFEAIERDYPYIASDLESNLSAS